jgi:poly-gamma-glutamate capsule biosynthesis protein CapA/YwtB (metallophosphatase superfamily)
MRAADVALALVVRSARTLFMSSVVVLLMGGAGAAHAVTRSDSPSNSLAIRSLRPPVLRTFTFVGGGDIALTGGADPRVLAGIRRYLRGADLVIGNLEGTLATGGAPKCTASAESGCFTFRGSPTWAAMLRRTGFTVLNVANNHAFDYGAEAQHETLAALQRARILSQGLPGQITYVRENGVKVASIGCAPYRWSQSLLDLGGTARLVHKAVRHADVVLVYMHAGAEGSGAEHVSRLSETYLGESRGNAREFAHAMIRAGADLVFGSGPHVVRGIEWYRGRVVAYSLGNLAGTHTLSTFGSLGDSALLRVTLDERGRFRAGSVVPVRLIGAGTPVFDTRGASIARIRALSHDDFGARAIRIAASGRLAAPRFYGPSTSRSR